jgi:hypothetical protein
MNNFSLEARPLYTSRQAWPDLRILKGPLRLRPVDGSSYNAFKVEDRVTGKTFWMKSTDVLMMLSNRRELTSESLLG